MHRFDATDEPLPATLLRRPRRTRSGVGEAIELARALGRLPQRIVVYGIEAESFAAGDDLSIGRRTSRGRGAWSDCWRS